MDFHSIATVVTFSFPFFPLHAFLCVGEAEESTQSSREIFFVFLFFFGGGGGRLVPSLHSSCIIYERALNGLAQGSAIM